MKDMATPANGDCLVHAPALVWDNSSGTVGDPINCTAEFMVYLCPDCDRVHLSVASLALHDGLTQFNAALTTKQADRLAHMLQAPGVVKWEGE